MDISYITWCFPCWFNNIRQKLIGIPKSVKHLHNRKLRKWNESTIFSNKIFVNTFDNILFSDAKFNISVWSWCWGKVTFRIFRLEKDLLFTLKGAPMKHKYKSSPYPICINCICIMVVSQSENLRKISSKALGDIQCKGWTGNLIDRVLHFLTWHLLLNIFLIGITRYYTCPKYLNLIKIIFVISSILWSWS